MLRSDFEVIIIGSDINAYYMARCTYEAYNKKAFLIGKEPLFATKYSNILNIIYNDKLHDTNEFINILLLFKDRFKDKKKLLLIPSNDHYVRSIYMHQDILSKYYIFHKNSLDTINSFLDKETFYNRYHQLIDIPKAYFFDINENLDDNKLDQLSFPIIVKASDPIEYNQCNFKGHAKVYLFDNRDDLIKLINLVKTTAYSKKLILQEYIHGNDHKLYDSIFYLGKDGKAKISSFGQIGLQEHTPTGVGNLTVLINGYPKFDNRDHEIKKLKKFIESLDYCGFLEFDLIFDHKDNKYKVLEINPRQARSSYYISYLGHNLVKYLVDDLIDNIKLDYISLDKMVLLSFVDKFVINNYIKDQGFVDKANELINNGACINPLYYKKDRHFLRSLWLFKRKYNYRKKYKNINWY